MLFSTLNENVRPNSNSSEGVMKTSLTFKELFYDRPSDSENLSSSTPQERKRSNSGSNANTNSEDSNIFYIQQHLVGTLDHYHRHNNLQCTLVILKSLKMIISDDIDKSYVINLLKHGIATTLYSIYIKLVNSLQSEIIGLQQLEKENNLPLGNAPSGPNPFGDTASAEKDHHQTSHIRPTIDEKILIAEGHVLKLLLAIIKAISNMVLLGQEKQTIFLEAKGSLANAQILKNMVPYILKRLHLLENNKRLADFVNSKNLRLHKLTILNSARIMFILLQLYEGYKYEPETVAIFYDFFRADGYFLRRDSQNSNQKSSGHSSNSAEVLKLLLKSFKKYVKLQVKSSQMQVDSSQNFDYRKLVESNVINKSKALLGEIFIEDKVTLGIIDEIF